jgi:AcrR family transcriptional regulator
VSNQDTEVTAPIELQPRNKPKQKRSRQTVERILAATAELLDEEGHDTLTTVRVAERSGVNIASLYNYFPNKQALLLALAEQFAEERQKLLDDVFDRFDELGWRDTMNISLDVFVDSLRTKKGSLQAFRAMQSHPALREQNRQKSIRNSETGASLMARAGICESPEKLRIMSMLLFQVSEAVWDNTLQWEPGNIRAFLDELKLMRQLYIEHYLERASGEASDED